MSDKQDPQKTFSNSFLFFLLAGVLIVLMIQSFIDTNFAKVSFSYQLEHLVNLKLIQPEDSRKTAMNDNLVTFAGRFRERVPEDGKKRYKYLELLNNHYELLRSKENLEIELKDLDKKIMDAAIWYLQLRGLPLPQEGYRVIPDSYEGGEKIQGVWVSSLPSKDVVTLAEVEANLKAFGPSPKEEQAQQLGRSLSALIRHMRSPMLGIGVEEMKGTLKDLEQQVEGAINRSSHHPEQDMALYRQAFDKLQALFGALDQQEDGMRLTQLRSVRNFREGITEFEHISSELDDNQLQLDKIRQEVAQVIWFFNNQELSTRLLEKQDSELFHQWFLNAKEEWDSFPQNKGGYFKAPDQPLNTVLEKTFKSEEPSPGYFNYLITFMPVILIVLLLYFIFSRQMKGIGTNAMTFGKSPAKLLAKGQNKITFKDVAGVDEAIEELQEIVEFLKNPQKFTALGGRIPKGVLCIGPPGTGKTLIAKAVAGEADRPFFSISGSDFVEMFVGVGASRIRDMFDQAKKNAPCIIFMDEIDAVGRHRGAGVGGGHDEREQTLNQLLVEMDGFDSNEGVILMAATNRPDVLDKALLRPGRFDRRVVIGLPDIKGRYEILKVHARKIKLDESVDLMSIARSTPGSSGADLANLLNEAALLAARKGRRAVTNYDVGEARDKVLYGKERRSLEIDETEKRTTAYHESGHAIVGLFVVHADPVDKVTIIPRGMALGATMFLPTKNRTSYWKKELHDQLAVLMGGRCAEEIFVGDMSSGAQQDIERATALARSMVCEWGMSDKLGAVAYDERSDSGRYLGMQAYQEKRYSEITAKTIDDEVRQIIEEAHNSAVKIIKKHSDKVELMTNMLMEFETLDQEDIQKIMHGTWNTEEKRKRLKEATDLQRVSPPAPPPLPSGDQPSSASLQGPLPTPNESV